VKILHRYVLKEHLGPLLFALTALTSLLLLQYIAKRFGELVGKGLPFSIIAEFLGLSVPLTVALSLPMAVMVATLYAFSRLAADNEITAMKASGVGLRRLLVPVLIAAAVLSLMMVGFNDQILPRANHRLRSLQSDIAQKKPTFGLREQVINEVSPGKLYLRAGHLSKTSNVMREVTLYDVGDATRRRTIYADSGNMAMTPDQADLQLTLYSGHVEDVPTDKPQQLQRLFFQSELVRVRGVGNEFQKTTNDIYKGEREMSVCEMERNAETAQRMLALARKEFNERLASARQRKIKLSREVLSTNPAYPRTIKIGTAYCRLLAAIGMKSLGAQEPPGPQDTTAGRAAMAQAPVPTPRGGKAARRAPTPTPRLPAPSTGLSPAARDASSPVQVPEAAVPALLENGRIRVLDALNSVNLYEVEIHKKFALAAACFVLALLGAPIALRFPRGGVGLTIGVSLIVFGLYYVALIAGESLARRGMVPAYLSMWGANILFTLIALALLASMGKEAGSSRAGDIQEMLETVRRRLRR
jgi:lipopolysaccharide export system permease protein